jgi:septal ring factor EnvC (AmiA/AmiB activator)
VAAPGSATTTPVTPPAPQPAATTAPRTYVVQRGDTLYAIARSYNISLDSLRTANNRSGNTIQPGQRLTIPGTAVAGGSAAASTAAATTAPGQTASSGSPAAASTPAAGTVIAQTADNLFWPSNGVLVPLQGKLTGVAIQSSPGSAVQAVRAGTVVSAGPFRGFGNVAFVQAADGLMYVYGGLAMINVKVGDSLRKASRIGLLSTDAEASAYFFVFRGAETIDPAQAPRD